MSKKEEFIEYVEKLINNTDLEMNEEAKSYWEALKSKEEKVKPLFTDNGKLILNFLKENSDDDRAFRAKDISEALFTSSRSVSGAIRKLVTDGYVEKIGQDPSKYCLTEKGKNINID